MDGGGSAIIESSDPMESDLGGDGNKPVDLSLERSGEGFVSKNPLTKVELPVTAGKAIDLQGGTEIGLPADRGSPAESLGEANLFYPETEASTDTLVSPVSNGIEIFEQLRSPESPERFSFSLTLPKGASLRATVQGGAEALSASGETIEETPPAYAVDAQGTQVPVTTSVEGDRIVVEVQHRVADVAYPLLLDPRFGDGKESPPFLSDWGEDNPGGFALSKSGSSLVAISQGWHKYGANSYGQWTFTAPGETAYIEELWSGPSYFYANKCYTSEPHGYIGVFNVNNWSYNNHIGVYSGGDVLNSYYNTGSAGTNGNRYVNVGIGAGGSSVELKCAHEFYVGGITVKENDPESPTISSVGGVPGGWFGPSSPSATVVASDAGFGVAKLSIFDGLVTNYDYVDNCTGLSGSRCPNWREWHVNPPYVEGEHSLNISAEDATGKTTEWPPVTTKYDASTPKIELDGQFATITEEAEDEGEVADLTLPVYNLKIDAIDGSNSEPKTKQSGIKNIEVRLDGVKQEVPWSAQSCPASSCAMERTYQLKLVDLAAGVDNVHKLTVIATDQVGLSSEREREFEYFPATGMKDEYVMQHFPLPDGEGDESEEEDPKRPELAVNVTNGNLVYRQRDVEVKGPAVNLEVERFYNSQLPAEDETEWGKGWTLAQTPKLKPEETKEEAPPVKASMMRTSGALESAVGLPTESGGTQFDKKLQAVVTKEPGGGYAVTDESGKTDTTLAFDGAGKVTELRTPGYAKVDYSYEEGDLSGIAVDDPSSTSVVPEEEQEAQKTPIYTGAIGTSGSGDGQFGSFLQGIATDSEGNFYVTDTANNRIEKFDSSGQYVSQFGSTGSGDGQFNSPRAVAVAPGGDVYVADSGNRRIERFNPSGEYVSKFGSQGSESGQFGKGIGGIAVDDAGNVWASDYSSHRLEKFDASGEYLESVTDSHLVTPWSIAVGADGILWVGDPGSEAVQEFNASGEYVATLDEGALKWPQGIATDAEDDLWVASSEGNVVVELDPAGDVLAEFGERGSGVGQFEEPTGLAIAPNGDFLISDAYNHRVEKWIIQVAPATGYEAPSDVTETTATLNASVDPRGLETHYSFEYGITSSYGSTAPSAPEYIGDGAEGVKVSETIKGLKPWVIYHYRIVATNAEGTTYGEDKKFTTPGQWSLESPPNPDNANYSNLQDVSCPSATSCLAVGHTNASESGTLAESWDGEEWSLLEAGGGEERWPSDVSCGTLESCWVAGTEGSGTGASLLVERYLYEGGWYVAGSKKTIPPQIPEGATSTHLNGISCSGEWECVAVGYYYVKKGQNNALVEQLTSSGWAIQPLPSVPGAVLEDVSCSSSESCLAVGYEQPTSESRKPLAELWDGSEWSLATIEGSEGEAEWAQLSSVSCLSAGSCLATGTREDGEGTQPIASSYDGSSLSPSTPPEATTGHIQDLSCSTSTSCLAVGYEGVDAFALAYNGTEWVTQPAQTPEGKSAELRGVFCNSSGACTAVGWATGGGETTTLAERINTAWSLESPPNPDNANYSNLQDVSCPSATSCLAVGHTNASESGTLAESWDGEEWSLLEAGGGEERWPSDVSCGTLESCWVAGTEGSGTGASLLVERYLYEGGWYVAGSKKTIPPQIPEGATSTHLNGISCSGEWECVAVGYYYVKKGQNNALVEQLTSSGWAIQPLPSVPGAVLEDVSCSSSESCLAVGYEQPTSESRKPLAELWDGSEWSLATIEGSEGEAEWAQLSSVSCLSAGSCLATGTREDGEGTQPIASSYDGSSLSPSTPPEATTGHIQDLSCSTSTSCLAVGYEGVDAFALAYNGTEWVTQPAQTPEGKSAELRGVFCNSSGACTAVGWATGGGETTTLAERIEAHNQKATTESATDVTREAASLNATVNPHSLDTHYNFEYGLTKAYGSSTTSKDAGSGIKDVTVSTPITGLEPSRLYHYRVVATSEIGTTYGADQTLTTPPPVFALQFGAEEGSEGQLSEPGGVATDAASDVYVSDPGKHRVVKFSPTGGYLNQFGEAGAGEGQFGEGMGPIAVGPEGDVYVADPAHSRVERFDGSGEYVSQLGSAGSGDGQFGTVIGGIAVDPAGVLWVSDSANHRVERFDSQGEYLSKLGSEGSGNGQFSSPRAIAIDASGNAWVLDLGHERVEEFSSYGSYLRQAGEAGEGNGQLASPAGVATDAAGDLWVIDAGNERLEEFDAKGQYLSQFQGAEEGEAHLAQPESLAIDPQGSLLIGDTGSDQIQKWFIQRSDANGDEAIPTQDDPRVELETSKGLVESLEGEEAGQIDYNHEGDMLTAVAGPKGETQYEYDSEERLTKVTLPNNTWGEAKYDEFGRVKAVTVSVEGKEAKTTYFEYQEEPSRRTTVTPENEQAVTYEFSEDGSVLKWWNAKVPPELKPLTGSLYNQRVEVHPEAINAGDQNLTIKAYDPEGIASIQLVANGNAIVAEKTCEQDWEEPGTECQEETKEFVTETEDWPPGILQLEVIVADRLEQVSSVRFTDNIPYTPAPNPEEGGPPKFSEVLRFREEFGLDLDLKGNELAINERIFNLIAAWNSPNTYEGEVARASMDRWGVPLRPVDVAEMEYREAYLAQAATDIPQWAATHAAAAYAGYYVDQRAGGVLHIGFTSDQAALVSQLKSSLTSLPSARLSPFPYQPTRTLQSLTAASAELMTAVRNRPDVEATLVASGPDVKDNLLAVYGTDTQAINAYLLETFGSSGPYVTAYAAGKINFKSGAPRMRHKDDRLLAGDRISGVDEGQEWECTLGFGASEQRGQKANGQLQYLHFGLTAGHCFALNSTVSVDQLAKSNEEVETVIGHVGRRKYSEGIPYGADAEAIRLSSGYASSAPKWIFVSSGVQTKVTGAESFVPGSTLCSSGVNGWSDCGSAYGPFVAYPVGLPGVMMIGESGLSAEGDSGGPVWDARNGRAVGLVSAGPDPSDLPLIAAGRTGRSRNGSETTETWIVPLEPFEGAPGVLADLDAVGGGKFYVAH